MFPFIILVLEILMYFPCGVCISPLRITHLSEVRDNYRLLFLYFYNFYFRELSIDLSIIIISSIEITFLYFILLHSDSREGFSPKHTSFTHSHNCSPLILQREHRSVASSWSSCFASVGSVRDVSLYAKWKKSRPQA